MRFIRSRPLVRCLRRASLRDATRTPTHSSTTSLRSRTRLFRRRSRDEGMRSH
ncbi:MAG TPA: hypothetical protein VE944_21370 [Nostoc sp.]|uniref:hypothetical protein n=1 Tax=Nostoc sp. TaxID=1180 RepID=UPI002D5EA793|nr:hypothetical protein [Nostoc sp.]HYX16850.1 hypothetical protein [Nostoc sp.]